MKVSAHFEREAQPGKEPRVYIPPERLCVELTDE
jgi:hypothetical protein